MADYSPQDLARALMAQAAAQERRPPRPSHNTPGEPDLPIHRKPGHVPDPADTPGGTPSPYDPTGAWAAQAFERLMRNRVVDGEDINEGGGGAGTSRLPPGFKRPEAYGPERPPGAMSEYELGRLSLMLNLGKITPEQYEKATRLKNPPPGFDPDEWFGLHLPRRPPPAEWLEKNANDWERAYDRDYQAYLREMQAYGRSKPPRLLH